MTDRNKIFISDWGRDTVSITIYTPMGTDVVVVTRKELARLSGDITYHQVADDTFGKSADHDKINKEIERIHRES